MTEKRFTLEQWTEESLYFSDGEYSAHMSIGYICKKVEKKLNEQQAINSALRTENNHLIGVIKEYAKKYEEQQATIKSKDKQLERLYNYFQDYLKDEMSGNAFSEMWDFVKEDEKWEDE